MSELILVRHGQSLWNLQNRFTGWYDVDLSDKGVMEAEKAGKLLLEKNIVANGTGSKEIESIILTFFD